ncbi:hypothetical protein LGN32_38020, partial [Burkholderia contaminans]|uniref:hypothetical protein n=1 Tax=Burkholderia contaminans TaxID=488447 RepID=UPI001CF42459
REVRPEYERNSPRMSSNSYVNLKIATCLVRYADDRLIDQRFPSGWHFSFLGCACGCLAIACTPK